MKPKTDPEATDTEPLYDEHVKEWQRHRETLHLPKRQKPGAPTPRQRWSGRRGHGRGRG